MVDVSPRDKEPVKANYTVVYYNWYIFTETGYSSRYMEYSGI